MIWQSAAQQKGHTMNTNKIAVVTGANTGLGYETSLGLAKQGHTVVLACRSAQKAEKALSDIRRKVKDANLDFIALDLINRDSIRAFASTFSERYDRLDTLINNAGVMGPPQTITPNGLELQFDANHVGHFLLTSLLLDRLERSEDGRIINVSSLAGKWPEADIHFDNLNFEGNYNEGPSFMGLPGFGAYCQSKLANILFTMELKERLAAAGSSIKPVVVHPGASNTDLSRHMSPMIRFMAPVLVKFMNISSPAEGAGSTLLAALDPAIEPGAFIGPTGKQERTGRPGPCELPPKAHDKTLSARLWNLSEELIGEPFKHAAAP